MVLLNTLITFFKDKEYRNLLITTVVIIGFGSIVYHVLEGWGWLDSIYFSVITLTTIGYGDFSPQTDGGKIFTIFFILVGVAVILSFINTIYRHYNRVRTEKYREDEGKVAEEKQWDIKHKP